jgi:hypothetical protein
LLVFISRWHIPTFMARLLSNTKREAKVRGHGYFDDFVKV